MFREITAKEIKDNAASLFDDDWGLLTSGETACYNTMTISWGTLGELWNRDICTVFVRPQRYTYEFMEKNDCFTVSFFPKEYRKALSFCGAKSGRDYDKAKETGLTAFDTGYGAAFEQAKLIVCCRKLYKQDLSQDGFIDRSILGECYPKNDLHRLYIGEVLKVLVKE